MVQKVGDDMKAYTSMLLRVLFPAVQVEKSGAAKRAFASACAILLKYAASSQAQKLIEDTVALHTGDRNAQVSCAILLKNYSYRAADVLSGYGATIIPVNFVARSDNKTCLDNLYLKLSWLNLHSLNLKDFKCRYYYCFCGSSDIDLNVRLTLILVASLW